MTKPKMRRKNSVPTRQTQSTAAEPRMTDLLSTDTLAAAAPVVKKALDALAPTIRRGAAALGKHLVDRIIANLQIGFTPYLQTSYDRCKSGKTLLSQYRTHDLLNV